MKLTPTNPATNRHKANLFFVEIVTLIAIIVWIAVSVYAAYSHNQLDNSIQSLLTPLTPILDIDALEQYKSTRIYPSDTFEITAVTTDNNRQTKTIINPFTATSKVVTTASPSAVPQSSNEIP